MNTTLSITITVDRAACARAGYAVSSDTATIEVDLSLLTPEERDEIARIHSKGFGSPPYLSSARDYESCSPACEPTTEAYLSMIRHALAVRANRAAQEAAERLRDEAAGRADAQWALAQPIDGVWLHGMYMIPYPAESGSGSHRRYAADAYDAVPGIRERRAEVALERERRIEVERRNEELRRLAAEAERRERAAREAAAVERLRTWAAVHGSELLAARIEGEYAWRDLAREEFTAMHAPSGYSPAPDEDRGPVWSPSLEEISACRQARQLVVSHPEVYASVDLVSSVARQYIDSETDADSENEGHAIVVTLVRIVIVCPDGHRACVERRLCERRL